MKLFICPLCGTLTQTRMEIAVCACGKHAGKYLDDKITAVYTKGAIIVGIDNNSYNQAVRNAKSTADWKDRVDFFFTGWIPNLPGEVLFKKTIEQVIRYKLPKKKFTTKSTMPTKE